MVGAEDGGQFFDGFVGQFFCNGGAVDAVQVGLCLYTFHDCRIRSNNQIVLVHAETVVPFGFQYTDYPERNGFEADGFSNRVSSVGEQFVNPYAIPEDIRQQEPLIRKLIQAKTDAETRLNSIKARILSMMEAQDIKSWATDTMRITRKLPTTRSSFSLADFKEAHSDIDIEPYMKISQVAGSLTIAI